MSTVIAGPAGTTDPAGTTNPAGTTDPAGTTNPAGTTDPSGTTDLAGTTNSTGTTESAGQAATPEGAAAESAVIETDASHPGPTDPAADPAADPGADPGADPAAAPTIGRTAGEVGEASGGPLAIVRKGLRLSPEFTRGIGKTMALAFIATVGRIVIPVAVQQALDHGFDSAGGADVGEVRRMALLAGSAVIITMVAAVTMNRRLYRSSESGLAALRVKAFRHVHELSVLHQQAEQRGSLVSRVTSDVDTITNFIQEGGLTLFVSIAQMVLATVVMAVYSWQLTLLVWVCFLPLFLTMRMIQKRTGERYGVVRKSIGTLLGAISESLVGAPVVRSYGIEEQTQRRIDRAIEHTRGAQIRTQRVIVATFSAGEIAAGLANAGVVVAGVLLGVGGQLSSGRLVAMLFLVSLFITPVQWGVEVINDAQNAVSGWRRVIGLLEARPDVPDPGRSGADLPPGPIGVSFHGVGFAYPGTGLVLREVGVRVAPRSRVAVVGETGSGKTTFAKLLTRLMDPTVGEVLINGVDLRTVPFEQLRRRVVMVPQDGFLFDGTIADNVRYGAPELTDEQVAAAFVDLGLGDWLAGLQQGVQGQVGQRGESLSAGERQLVALVRAYVADPDLLLLDEATSAVDPATELRLQRALDRLTRGRTTVSIAHRLSTAQAADVVLVFDGGYLVENGPHDELVAAGGIYSRLHASWVRQSARK